MERTLVILKPDALQRRLVGRIIERFESKGLSLGALKLMHIGKDLAEKHYAEHKGKDFYERLINYITASPSVVMVVQGHKAIEVSRKLIGQTFSSQAEPGTIRGDFALIDSYNLVHGSDSPGTAEHEISLYFRDDEILSYDHRADTWVA